MSSSLCDFVLGLGDEFEGWCRGLLGEVARDYGLKEQELVDRYITARPWAGSARACLGLCFCLRLRLRSTPPSPGGQCPSAIDVADHE